MNKIESMSWSWPKWNWKMEWCKKEGRCHLKEKDWQMAEDAWKIQNKDYNENIDNMSVIFSMTKKEM